MTDTISATSDIPALLTRDQVPLYFPQFTSARSLAYVALKGTGPLFKVISGRAWYACDEIIEWLAESKSPAPKSNRNAVLVTIGVQS